MATENPFWDYSVRVYSRKGAAPACLRLQDGVGADVNVLLYCCWVAHRGGVVFDDGAMKRVLARVAPWKSSVVEPLRTLRRTLKSETFDGFDPDVQDRFRTDIKRAELHSERLQQDALLAFMDISDNSPLSNDRGQQGAVKNINRYLETLDARIDDAVDDDVRLVVDAAFSLPPIDET